MAGSKLPSTPAIHFLKKQGVEYTVCPYRYEEKGGTSVAARELGVDEHLVIKTLVMETDNGEPFLILMHGDRTVSTKALAREMGVKNVKPCSPREAHRHTGYTVGGISPFGTRKSLRVYVEESLLNFPRVYVNAGKKGLLVEISPKNLVNLPESRPVNVAVE